MAPASSPLSRQVCGLKQEAAPASLLRTAQFDAPRARHYQSEERLALAHERFGGSRPDRLEFVRVQVERSGTRLFGPARIAIHPTADRLLRMSTPQLEMIRFGLAENWRRGPSVVLYQ